MNERCADVVIVGGGLAGLTLALQLRQRVPELRISVLERHAHPVREAAFKVGESSVEIGAHYFAEVLGLREHLDAEQIRKFGFRFFFSDRREDLDRCTELGVSQLLPTPSWQIDRGRFENFLGTRARALGVEFLDASTVRGIDLADDDGNHCVRYARDGVEAALHARWVVDASGRAGLLKRKLGLAQDNAHRANAVWWRVDGHIDPNAWSQDNAWLQRCTPPDRWRSTNHMCGPGYWFWMIPLSSGAHSLGIVCDATLHPLETMNSHDKAMAWLRTHQPQIARTLEHSAYAVQDFMFLRDFSYGCKHVFSAQRWALTGEAGVFLDPFYSPGNDFIAISNTYICELIALERDGRNIAPYATLYQQLYFSFYENTLTLYQDQYPLFGDAQVMPVKVIWDYTYYWSLLAPLYCSGRTTNVAVLGQLRPAFEQARALNLGVQALLRNWGAANRAQDAVVIEGRLLDQYLIDWFHELNRALHDRLDDAAFVARLHDNVAHMATLASEILERAHARHPALADHGLTVYSSAPGPAPILSAAWYADAA
ncbi:NAD(P)/FAD-dependent oxidoreductase [Xanthomonas albilineans]|uniref:NAD(P)/FAD-dependent oxidoreductase n=1 Tax=Xanthomonas albilineans TaxID=29447 RepID=UPI0005F31556|nr:NAD(P)/FAD-dependent oxidoreductase [Xanthomonas albilineans]PPU93889.1 NAD(P)/FAD-dependent oxidoreductase [Xanthomonas albilineans]